MVNDISGTVGKYTTSGATVNASLVTRLDNPTGIAVSGSRLFVNILNLGTVGKYTTSGATVNASLIRGLSGPYAIAHTGSDLFVTSGVPRVPAKVGEYTTSGATVNASLVSGLGAPNLALPSAGSDLFVTDQDFNTVGEYDDAYCPTITTFTPTSGPVGTVVTIKGTNLLGATSVTFNGVAGDHHQQ